MGMTDNEIIKALECCKRDDCDNCPNDFGNCYANLAGFALDLINRKKAEIERLESALDAANYTIGYFKAEAIKEFAERLKEMDGYNNHTFDDCASVLIPEEYQKGRYEKTREIWDTIDRLVKEMVGDNNGNTQRKEDEGK